MPKSQSFRGYVLKVLMVVISIVVLGLSMQSAWYFFSGRGHALEEEMEVVARNAQAEPGKLSHFLEYQVTADWALVPERIRLAFGKPPQKFDDMQMKNFNWIYVQPPEKTYLLMKGRDSVGQTVYVSKIHDYSKYRDGFDLLDPVLLMVWLGLLSLAALISMVYLVLKKLTSPLNELQNWVAGLAENVPADVPDFKYQELNELAQFTHQSFQAHQQSLEREKSFLNHASHELRTPIAVIRTSSRLLEKMNPDVSSKEAQVRQRIDRASLIMKDTVETLLWLNRDEIEQVQIDPVAPGKLLKQLVSELNYLIKDRPIVLDISCDERELMLPATVVRIILSNLIRNAFQHTPAGNITISQSGASVRIENDLPLSSESDLQGLGSGFGLGLKLISQLAEKFNWDYQSQQKQDRYIAEVSFSDREAS